MNYINGTKLMGQKSKSDSGFTSIWIAFCFWVLMLGFPVLSFAIPSVENDSATTLVNTPVSIDLVANDSGNWISGSLSQPSHGTLAGLGGGVIKYTPNTDFTGTDSFTYTLKDSTGPSFMAAVTITVSTTPASIVRDDSRITQRNTKININVAANDNGNWVKGTFSQPLHGKTVGLGGGFIEYTPNHDFLGYDKYTYRFTDTNGATLVGTVNITVLSKDAPDVQNDSIHLRPNTSASVNLMMNDTGSWDSGSYSPPSNGTLSGQIITGILNYIPNLNFIGVDTGSYFLTDINGLTPPAGIITFKVDNAPILQDDFAATNLNTPVTINVLNNDDLIGITTTTFTQPAFGTVAKNGDALTYTPNAGYTGFDRFNYSVTDGDNNTDTAKVSISVNSVVFKDVTAEAGIDYVQCVAPCSGPPTAMTGGAAAGDFNKDGKVDLYVTRMDAPDILYLNNGNGTFTDITQLAGINRGNGSNGAAWGDVDNDGDLDLYVTSTNDTRFYLYINNGPAGFSEEAVIRGASIQGADVHDGFSVSFGDYDKDGYLDIHTNEWRKDEKNTTGAPSNSKLLRNMGAGNPGFFEDVTQSAGVALDGVVGTANGTFAFTSHFIDLDNDGYPDLTIAADAKESRLFWNNKDGTFTDGTAAAGVGGDAGDENGMGSTFADINGDNLMDWFISSIYDPDATCAQGAGVIGTTGNRMYINNGDRTFTDATTATGVRDGGWGWGATFIDYDNDGDQDLVHTNGFRAPRNPFNVCWWDDQTRFFENNGDGTFTEKASSVGLLDSASGKGLLKFDYDNDGDQDIFIVNAFGKPILYRNDGGNANGWLRIKFATTEQYIGARILLQAVNGGPKQFWAVNNNSNFLAQDEVTAHFGLGPGVDPIFKVQIRMPSGILKTYNNIPRNKVLVVKD